MIVKEEIFTILRKNYNLRKLMADEFDIREVTIYRWAGRKSQTKLSNEKVSVFIREKLNLSKEDYYKS